MGCHSANQNENRHKKRSPPLKRRAHQYKYGSEIVPNSFRKGMNCNIFCESFFSFLFIPVKQCISNLSGGL